jgi:diacylglycerol kinase family enzyme
VTRLISLGRADERYFTFCAGLGLDADVVASIERLRQAGHRSTHSLYVRTAVRRFWSEVRDAPLLTITDADTGEEVSGVELAVVQNTVPWTYLGRRPLTLCPDASFDADLDVFLLRKLRTSTTLRLAQQLLRGADPRSKHVSVLHDRARLVITAAGPVPHQVDGDYLGHRESVTLSSHPEALRVLV